ncbi:MAG: LamG domain-containing protein [Candidatus Pacearchaeota archaeon]
MGKVFVGVAGFLICFLFITVIILANFTTTGFAIFEQSSEGNFNEGTYENTQWNGSAVTLSSGETNGNYTSKVFDAGLNVNWNNISWVSGKYSELPNNQENDGNVNMANNFLLLHLNEDYLDYSGNENHGESVGGLTFGEGVFGEATIIDGSNEYISVTNDGLSFTNSYSIEFWIKPSASASQWSTMVERTNQFIFDLIAGDKVRVQGTGYSNLDSSISIPREKWNHIVFTLYDTPTGNDILKLYLNGQIVGTIGPAWGTPASSSAPLKIGGIGGTNYVAGIYDEFASYSRVLSEDEVKERYKRGIMKLEVSARSCDDSQCSGESWTNLETASPQNLTIDENRYFQYRFNFKTGNSSYSPFLSEVTIDYTPLSSSPFINIISPTNTNYPYNELIYLNYSVYDLDEDLESCWYTLDSEQPVILNNCENTSFYTEEGTHTLTLYANDTLGAESSSNVSFNSINTAPTITLVEPSNGTTYGYNESIELRFLIEDAESDTDSCWYIINGGENEYIENCENTTFSVPGNEEYLLLIYINDSLNEQDSDAVLFSVSLGAPTITVHSPIDGEYLNHSEVEFSYTPTDIDLESCMLWGDFDGEFKVNQTKYIGVGGSGLEDKFTLTLTDGVYNWNIKCNDSEGNSAFNGNKTLYIDATSPKISISEPIGTKKSRTAIPLTTSVIDNSPTTCLYNIYRGQNIEIQNTSINCSGSSSFSVTVDADFVLNFYSNDSAGNSNYSVSNFKVDTSTTTIPEQPSGGGSGGGSILVTSAPSKLKITPVNIIVMLGEERSLQVSVKNEGRTSANKCRLIANENYSDYIESKDIKNIGVGEIVEFPLLLKVLDKEIKNMNLSIVCLENVSGKVPLSINILENKLNTIIKEITIDSNELLIKYEIATNIDSVEEVYFRILSSLGEPVKEILENINLKSNEPYLGEIKIPLSGINEGVLKISVTDKNKEEIFIEEEFIYERKNSLFTGNVILEQISRFSYVIVILLVFLILAIVLVKRILKLKKILK